MLRISQVLALAIGLLMFSGGVVAALCPSPSPGAGPKVSPNPPILDAWIINTNGTTNPHWPGVAVNVQSVTQTTINGAPYVQVRTNRIADYNTTMTQQLLNELNGRPRAASDFRSGQTTATLGQIVRFGDDIGYVYRSCNLGYWAPGPGCPTSQARTYNIPMQPIQATQVTSTSLGATGLWIDGTTVFNWSDGQSYNNGNVWQNAAMSFEVYDMDICPGHAAMGDYHHHSYSDCVAQLVNDTGQDHSPVYGFGNDGYPIYGPWEGAGVLAESGWKARDYDNATSPTGCGVARVRNCLLRNPLDYTQGTYAASQTGPRTDATVLSLSQNVISATSGIYLQDYWYDNSCSTCLDSRNGHNTNDGRGYHYHVTVRTNPNGGRMIPAFPYTFGPRYAGQLNPSITYTPTRTATAAIPTATATYTATPTPAAILVGHVTWQGPPSQPDSRQQLPVTLTLKLGASEINYPSQTTDSTGFFTVTVGNLPAGNYDWRVKGPKYLANAGTVTLGGLKIEDYKSKITEDQSSLSNLQSSIQTEMGLMKVGDANGDNVVNVGDFNVLKGTFGKGCGDPGYDDRAEFNGDCAVNVTDFNWLRLVFGQAGVPPIDPR